MYEFMTISLSLNIALVDSLPVDDQTKVTNEVLKRAENAIFARAINAIRPIEIKKICPERQKLYSNEVTNEHEKSSPPHGSDKPSDDLLQITVINSEQERSVEIKSSTRQQRNKTPIRSIKERLGKKLNDDTKSRSRTPQRKIVTENRNERTVKSRSKERRSRENDKRQRDDRDRKFRSPKSNDNRRSSVTRRNDSQKPPDRSYRDKDRRPNSSEQRDTKEVKDIKKNSRDHSEKDPQTDSAREEQKVQIDERGRERIKEKARVRAKMREEERTKSQQGKQTYKMSIIL